MEKRIGIVANLRAGAGIAGFAPIMAEKEYRRLQGQVFYHLPDSVSKLSEALLELILQKKVQVLLVYGGDGSLQKVIDILLFEKQRGNIEEIPPIMTLGGGTQKSIFQWLGWGQGLIFNDTPIRLFRKVIKTPLEHLPIRKKRPLAISFYNSQKGREETHFGFIFIMGAISRVISLYDQERKTVTSGLKHIALGMLASLTGFPTGHKKVIRQFSATQTADGQALPSKDPLSVICSVTDSLLFGIKPFVGQIESNQFFVASYAMPPLFISSLVPVAWRGTFVPPCDRFFNKVAFSFQIEGEEKTFFLDGDFFDCSPWQKISITLGPELSLISRF